MAVKKYLAELIGTFVLVTFGCGSVVFASGNFQADLLSVAFAFGLSATAMTYTIGDISGCHINPAVTVAMLCTGKISLVDACGYILSQISGAIAGGGLLFALFSIKVSNAPPTIFMSQSQTQVDIFPIENVPNPMLGSNTVAGAGGIVGGLIVEVVLTLVFILVILGITSSDKYAKQSGLVIGLALTLVHILGINLTGTSVNPARSIGPAIFAGRQALTDLWVFIVGPIVGALLAVLVWRGLSSSKK